MKGSRKNIRSLVEMKLNTGNIVIWGIGDKAQEFYQKYKDRYNITTCVSSQINHREYLIDKSDGFRIADWSQYERKENDYIIIFETPYAHKENQLLAEGFVLFEDYVEMYVAEFIASGKKLAIMAGNCQIGVVFGFFKGVKSFSDEYYLLRFSTHYWKSRWSLKSISVLKSMCDLYLCMLHEEDDVVFWKKEELPDSCRIVILPYIMGRLYWPQMKAGLKSVENEFFLKKIGTKEHGPFDVGDVNINRMIEEGKTVEEIVRLLTSEDFYTEKQVKKHIESVLRVMEFEEHGCDIKVLPYIQKNYMANMLYRDMTHMQPILVCEYVRQILAYLEIDDTEIDEILEKGKDVPVYQEYSVHCTEMPIYPSVAKHMGLKWWHKDYKWDVRFYNGIQKMTFEEYIRAYYSVCSKMKQIIEEW